MRVTSEWPLQEVHAPALAKLQKTCGQLLDQLKRQGEAGCQETEEKLVLVIRKNKTGRGGAIDEARCLRGLCFQGFYWSQWRKQASGQR